MSDRPNEGVVTSMSERDIRFFDALQPLEGVVHLLDPDRLHGVRCNRHHKRPLIAVLNLGAVTCLLCRPSPSDEIERRQ